MPVACFRFYAELNDFLPAQQRGAALTVACAPHQTVKHLIEALGVPHTEVARVLVDGGEVGFSHQVKQDAYIEVYPAGAVETQSTEAARFVLDAHLGRLAVYLRMLGFDSLYRNDYGDEELAQTSSQDRRILLTRDVRLLMRNRVYRGYWVRSKVPRQQLAEVVRRFDLHAQAEPFKRCTHCNTLLQPVSKEAILERLEPLTRRYFHEFRICPACDHIYWAGSHYERMLRLVNQVLEPGA